MVIFAGKEYGTGSSRDWAAKGTRLLGVRVIIGDATLSRTLEAGLGIGPLPTFMAQAPTLERVLPDYFMTGAPLQIVMPSASYVPARVAAVRDFLHARLTDVLNSCDRR